MTIVFVHGVPETTAIWASLFAELRTLGHHDTVTLSPPGFGAPLPANFNPTSDSYAHWLVGELEKFDAPVDLVGHDWGGGHVMRAVIARPELVNRWCTDIAGCFDPTYVWHDMAQLWQTEGDGEAIIAGMAATPIEANIESFVGLGMTPEAARSCAEAAATPEMGRAILALYRSAAQPKMTEFGNQMQPSMSVGRSLVLIASEDTYTGGEVLATRTAQRWGSEVEVLEGLGHWWMMQDPIRSAEALSKFFNHTPSTPER
jgi:pimeloyl-ACP methyl ester carboxylesterase